MGWREAARSREVPDAGAADKLIVLETVDG
jgi:hypothetical protein